MLQDLGGFELHPLEEFGIDELRRSGHRRRRTIFDEVALRAVPRARRRASAIVPASFPLLLADRLRAAGVELTPDRDDLRPPPPRQVRRRARGHPSRPGRRRGRRWAPRATCSSRDAERRRRARARRRAADERARQGARSRTRLRASTARAATTSSSRTGRSRRSATTSATGAIARRRADRDRPLAAATTHRPAAPT